MPRTFIVLTTAVLASALLVEPAAAQCATAGRGRPLRRVATAPARVARAPAAPVRWLLRARRQARSCN